MRLHLDTDFAGDPDDACALAMLLGWADLEITGITTVADPDGRRAAYVRRLLAMVGRDGIPVAVGAAVSLDGAAMGGIPDHERYWGEPSLDPAAGHKRPEPATAALTRSIAAGATVAAIGPLTNLAALERTHAGTLRDVSVVAMAGWFEEPASPGLPRWGPAADWNTQCDPHAAQIVAASADLTLVPLSVTANVCLRRQQLGRLQAAGPLGELLARQALAYCADEGKTEIALAHKGLPDDLLNFHHDPLTAAVAAGWDGVTQEEMRLRPHRTGPVMSFVPHPDGRRVDVATDVDSAKFDEVWISAVERAAAPAYSES